MRLPLSPRSIEQQLGRLRASGRAIDFDRSRHAFIGKAALAELKASALDEVRRFQAAHPAAEGLPREALRARVAPDPRLLLVVVDALVAEGAIRVAGDAVRLGGAEPGPAALSPLADQLASVVLAAAHQPPTPAELAVALKKSAQEIAAAIDMLTRRRILVRVKDLFFHQATLVSLRERLVAHLQAHGTVAPQEWKALVGTSRKFSIPLAEHFDAAKVTLRVGDVRKLRSV